MRVVTSANTFPKLSVGQWKPVALTSEFFEGSVVLCRSPGCVSCAWVQVRNPRRIFLLSTTLFRSFFFSDLCLVCPLLFCLWDWDWDACDCGTLATSQGRFKQLPRGDVYIGVELEETPRLPNIVAAMVRAFNSLVSVVFFNMNQSINPFIHAFTLPISRMIAIGGDFAIELKNEFWWSRSQVAGRTCTSVQEM
jgi:hypothetical protein